MFVITFSQGIGSATPPIELPQGKGQSMSQQRTRFGWAAWLSILLSLAAIASPYLFPSLFPGGSLPYYTVTIPVGIVAGLLAYAARNWWLAGLSPLLFFWVTMVLLQIAYVLTGGRFPGPEWL